jgi:hypothetical protein
VGNQGACGGINQFMYTCVVGLMLLKGRRSCQALQTGDVKREFVPLVPSIDETCISICGSLRSVGISSLQDACHVACIGNLRVLTMCADALGRQLTSANCRRVHGIACALAGFVVPVVIKYIRELLARRAWASECLPQNVRASGISGKEIATLRWSFGVVSVCFLIVVLS